MLTMLPSDFVSTILCFSLAITIGLISLFLVCLFLGGFPVYFYILAVLFAWFTISKHKKNEKKKNKNSGCHCL